MSHANCPLTPVIVMPDADFNAVTSALEESEYPAMCHIPERRLMSHPVQESTIDTSEEKEIRTVEFAGTENLTNLGN